MTFKQFLLSHNVDIALFEQNCLPQHQQGNFGHKGINELFIKFQPYQWINSFNWSKSLQKGIDWSHLQDQWWMLVKLTPNTIIKSGWNTRLFTRL